MQGTQRFIRTLAALAAAALLLAPGAALAQSTGGDVKGRVVDGSGAPLPGVTITATNKSTGAKRLDTTGADGTFALRSWSVGDYTVVAELDGFSGVTVDDVHVSVASSRALEVTMSASTVQESITVVDEAPLVSTTPSIGTTVSQQELESLPLNGRQFANVAVLAPGTSLDYNSDPTKPGQLTIALNGGIGRNVNFLVDGGDNTDDTIGGQLQNFNLDAVQEFKIQTAQYKAEFGRSSGGVLSVLTKTGGNDLQASVFDYARRDSLNTQTETEKQAGAEKAPYKRDQYGGTLGGPIVRDKAHFFLTYEKQKRDNNYTIDTRPQNSPTPIYPDFQGASVAIPFTDELGTGKLSLDISDNQLFQVRYGYQKNADLSYGAAAITLPSALGSVNNEYSSWLASHTWQIGSDRLNEAIFQYTKFENGIVPSSTEPFLLYPSGVTSGQNANTPQTTLQNKYQYKDDFSFSSRLGGARHDFKTGLSWMHEPTLGGSFTTGTAGQYTLLEDRVGSPVTDITFAGGFAGFSTPVDQYSAYFQDDWFASSRLTVNLGLRYDVNTGFDLDQRNSAVWQALSTQTQFHEGYLQDFQGGKGGKLKEDRNNYSPRVGFSWDMKGDGRRLLHGGIGRFYDFPYTNATILFPSVAVQSNYGQIYNLHNGTGILNPDGSFFQPGDPLPPEGVLSGGLAPASNDIASPTLATPYSDQLSLGYSWQVNESFGLTFDAISARYRDIPFRFRANPFLDANGNPQATRRFPAFGNFRIWYGKGEADYQAVNIGFRLRREKFTAQGFYTLSHAEGNVLAGADEFRIWNTGFQADILNTDAPVNTLDPLCDACKGDLNTDARHRVTFAATYVMPWQLQLSGFFRYRSALPYTQFNHEAPDGGIADTNHDGFRQDLAPGVSHVNTGRGDAFSQFDLRLGRDFRIGDFGFEVIAEVFNVFNRKNGSIFDSTGTPSAFAGDPLQGEQRLGQIGLRLHWR
jgi:hypothetical protein